MKLTSVVQVLVFVVAQSTSAVADNLKFATALGSSSNSDGAHDGSATGASLSEFIDIEEDKESSKLRGLRGTTLFDNNEEPRHPKLLKPPENVTVFDGEYLVILEESVEDVEAKIQALLKVVNLMRPESEAEGFGSLWNINDSFKGQAVRMTHEQAEIMSELDGVKFIEHNIELGDQNRLEKPASTEGDAVAIHANTSSVEDVPWNLDRIDQTRPNPSGSYSPKFDGSGVLAVILDDGIRSTHTDFEGRVINSGPFIPESQSKPECQPRSDRLTGDGTYLAAIVGGKKYGVAKKVDLVDIRTSCGTQFGKAKAEHLVGVIQFIGNDLKNNAQGKKVVVNGSFTFAPKNVPVSLENAFGQMIDSGVVYVGPAGDVNGQPAQCDLFPANLDKTISVGATELIKSGDRYSDGLFDKTNRACADIYAPGSKIESASRSSNNGSETKSGGSTSFAAAHVTGAAAMILQEFSNSNLTPAQVKAKLKERANDLRDRSLPSGINLMFVPFK